MAARDLSYRNGSSDRESLLAATDPRKSFGELLSDLESGSRAETALIAATALAMTLLFVVDLLVPLGVAVGALYVMCLSFLLAVRESRWVVIFAVLAGGLTSLALLLASGQELGWMVLVNRAISLLVIAVVAVLLVRYKRDRQEAEQRLITSRQRLMSLSVQLQTAEERERRNLADFLHDEIGQPLAIMKMKMATLGFFQRSGPARTSQLEVEKLLTEVIERTRSMTVDLSPPILDQIGLSSAIEWMCGRVCAQHGLQFHFEHDGQPDRLSRRAALLLFRGTRELVMNTVKHASASSLSVAIAGVGRTFKMRVVDDGCGFDPDRLTAGTADGGYGLYSLREQLRLLGGHLEIDSGAGDGTRVEMKLPFDAEPWAAVAESAVAR